MKLNEFVQLVPDDVPLIGEPELLSNQGAWRVEYGLVKETVELANAESVAFIHRDPEVEPRMIAMFKTKAGCDSDLCQHSEIELPTDQAVRHFVKIQFSS